MIARHLDMDPARVADHLAERIENVQAALAYAAAYPGEIDPIVDQVTALRFDDVKRMIPGLINLRV